MLNFPILKFTNFGLGSFFLLTLLQLLQVNVPRSIPNLLPVPRKVQDFLDSDLAPNSGAGAIGTAECIFASAKAGEKLKFASFFSHPCHVDDSGYIYQTWLQASYWGYNLSFKPS